MMNSRGTFVFTGVVINVLLLVRGILLMGLLDYTGLGLIALMQSVILFAGMLHFGLLNGGYRLLCHAGPDYRQRIVNLAYSVFGVVAVVIAIGVILVMSQLDTALFRFAAALSGLAGICTLLRSWMLNEMVAAGKLRAANLINSLSMAVSLALLGLYWLDPVLIGVISITAQPVVFVLLALASGAVLRPRRMQVSRRILQVIYRAGFVLFLTGLAVQLNSQLERWYVSGELGLEALGHLYLAFLFLTLFQIVPTLFDQVVLPTIVRAWKARDYRLLTIEMRRLLLLNFGYCVVTVVALWLIAPLLLGWVLPAYLPDLRWVYLIAPGAMALAMAGPFAIAFNVVIDYTWYMIAYGASVVVTGLAFGAAWLAGDVFSLDGVIILRSAVSGLMAVLLVTGWWQLTRRHREFLLFTRN